jgi:hypothetical protein
MGSDGRRGDICVPAVLLVVVLVFLLTIASSARVDLRVELAPVVSSVACVAGVIGPGGWSCLVPGDVDQVDI